MGRHKIISRGIDISRKHGWFIRVGGKKRYFPSQKERDTAFTNQTVETRTFGMEGGLGLGAHDRVSMVSMVRRALEVGARPEEIFEVGLKHWNKAGRNLSVRDLVEQFHLDLDARLARAEIRKVTASGLRKITRSLAAFAGDIKAADLDQGIADRFAAQGGVSAEAVSAQTAFNRVAAVATLCGWAVRRGLIQSNPIRRPRFRRGKPAIFTADTVQRLFRLAASTHPKLVPMLALQWFVGMRPSASHAIRWEDVDFTRKRIAIPAGVSKSGEPEVIDRIQPAAWKWLRATRRPTGRLCDPNHLKGYRRLKAAMRLDDWPQDVARHTFASHLYGLTDSMEAVANALLHQTTRVTLKHYVAFGVTKAEARRYFSIRPRARARTGRHRRTPTEWRRRRINTSPASAPCSPKSEPADRPYPASIGRAGRRPPQRRKR